MKERRLTENHRIPGGAPSVWTIIGCVADAIRYVGTSGEPELRVLMMKVPQEIRRRWASAAFIVGCMGGDGMSDVMVRQEGYDLLVRITPGMTTDKAIAPVPSTESE